MLQKITLTLILAILPVFLIAQDDGILPNQVTNLKRLAYRNGFTENTLAAYVHQVYGESISDLSQEEGANLIRSFLYDNKPKPLTTEVTGGSMWTPVREFLSERKDNEVKPVKRELAVSPEPEIAPIIASILEVGMEKRFHLLDGNIIQGTIIKKENGICHIETIDGILRVPDDAILEETAHVVKKDDTRYVGPVLKETPEEIVIRSIYGDGSVAIFGRSDATLNPGGVRIGTAEIYRVVDKIADVDDSLVIGYSKDGIYVVVLFLKLAPNRQLDDHLTTNINTALRTSCSPRHVPNKIVQVPDIPYTINGKKVEIAVREVLQGENPKNRDALANPDSLEFYAKLNMVFD